MRGKSYSNNSQSKLKVFRGGETKVMSKKFIAIFTALALVVTLLAPIGVQEASAASIYTVTSGVKSFSKPHNEAGANTPLDARIKVEIPENAMTADQDYLFMELPAGVTADVYATLTDAPSPNQFANVSVVENNGRVATGRQEVKIEVDRTGGDLSKKGIFFIELRGIQVQSRYNGDTDVNALFTAEPNSVFTSDKQVTIAKVTTGSVTPSMLDIDTITDSDAQNIIGDLRITEDLAGALTQNGGVKLKLPRGFYWDANAFTASLRYGEPDPNPVKVTPDDDIRVGNATKFQSVVITLTNASTKATSFDVKGLKIEVDSTLANHGEVVAAVSGSSGTSVTISELTVAVYGDYLAEVTALETPHRLAGKSAEKLGKFEIKELIGTSLVENRTVTMTLPVGAKWSVDANGNARGPKIVSKDSVHQNTLDADWKVIDIEGRTIRTHVANPTTTPSSAAKLVFEDARVALDATFEGDLEVTFGGSAGVGGTITLAKVTPPVTAKASEITDVRVGFQKQKLGDLIITETKSGAMERGEYITVRAPLGVMFASTPVAEVLEGDAIIERIWTSADKYAVHIQVLADSDKVSEIKLSNIEVTIDRTLPEGELEFTLGGAALVDSNLDIFDINNIFVRRGYFPQSDVSAWVKVANIVTPASRDTRASDTVVITIGQNDFTVGEETWTMDAPAFIDANGRTMMPLRAVAEALNVSSDDILWEPHSKTVTIMKGDRTAQVQIGKRSYIVNGITVPMDTEAVIVSERTFLPLRHVANALGVSNDDIEWDENTKTVTIFGKKDN